MDFQSADYSSFLSLMSQIEEKRKRSKTDKQGGLEVAQFELETDLTDESKKNISIHLPGNSSIYGNENIKYLLDLIKKREAKK